MAALLPDARTRLAIDELDGVALAGGPATARVTDLATGAESDVAAGEGGAFSLPVVSAPRLLRVEWEAGGVTVSAEADVVVCRTCTPDEVRAYRPDYELTSSDEEVALARARAEEALESELGRHLQPVMRLGRVCRPTCAAQGTLACVVGEGGYAADVQSVPVARSLADGRELGVAPVAPGSSRVDVSRLRCGESAEVAYVTGMRLTAEACVAVRALASWYLAPRTAPENATSTSTEVGVMSFVVAGVGSAATSLPEVNAYLARNRLSGQVVA